MWVGSSLNLTTVELKGSLTLDFCVRWVRRLWGPSGCWRSRGRGRGRGNIGTYLPNSGQERLRVSATHCSRLLLPLIYRWITLLLFWFLSISRRQICLWLFFLLCTSFGYELWTGCSSVGGWEFPSPIKVHCEPHEITCFPPSKKQKRVDFFSKIFSPRINN